MNRYFPKVLVLFVFIVPTLVGCSPSLQCPVCKPSVAQAEPDAEQQVEPAPELEAKATSCDHSVPSCCDHELPKLKHSNEKIAAFLGCMQKVLEVGENAEERKQAARMLAYGGLPQAKVLIKHLVLEEKLAVRRAIIKGLAAMGERINPRSGLNSTMVIDPSENPPIMWKDEGQKIQETVVPFLVNYARSASTYKIRGDAAHALGWFNDRTSVPVLEKIALEEDSQYVRLAAITALGSELLLPPAVTPTIRKIARDKDSSVRQAVAKILGGVHDPEATGILVDMIDKESSASDRKYYQIWINHLSSPVFLNVLGDAFGTYKSTRTKLIILDALKNCGFRDGATVLPILEKLLSAEKDASLKAAIQEAIKDIKSGGWGALDAYY